MVRFSVFNELSLPFKDEQNIRDRFIDFFKLLEGLKKKGLGKLRMSEDFEDFEILQGIGFQQFIGKQEDRDFARKITGLLTDRIILIESPIIQEDETNEEDIISGNDYCYQKKPNSGGLACCDVWGALAVSFNSSDQWNTHNIELIKKVLLPDSTISEKKINVKHSSKVEHLNFHNDYFNNLEKEIKLNITQEGFWKSKGYFFPNIVIFCPEVEKQIIKLDKLVFKQAINILRDVETQQNLITDFNHSGESETIRNNQKLKKMRMFTLNGQKTFFENHIKSLPNGHRIYFIECNNRVYIGYIGKHLKT